MITGNRLTESFFTKFGMSPQFLQCALVIDIQGNLKRIGAFACRLRVQLPRLLQA